MNTKHNPINNKTTFESIDEVLASVSVSNPKASKFNYSPVSTKKKSKFLKRLILISFCVLCIGSIVVLPSFVGKADIVPITSTASNEKLAITSKKSAFFAKHNNNYYYANNQNGVWTLDLGFITGKTNIEIGNYINLGGFKIHSSKTENFELNRNYEIAEVTTTLKKYITSKSAQFDININSKETYFKVLNNDKVLYETNSNSNSCTSKYDSKTIITCPYINQTETETTIQNNLTILDEYGNSKKIDPVVTEVVLANDFYCDISSIYYNSKVYCYGSKNGKIKIGNQESIDYIGGVRVALPINLQDGQNKHNIVMTDIHDLEVEVKLDFNYDSTPLDIKFVNSDTISANSNRKIVSIQYVLTGKYSVIVTGRKFDRDLSKNLKIIATQLPNGVTSSILDSKIPLTYEEVRSIKNLDQLLSAELSIIFTDVNGKTLSHNCTTKGMEVDGYYLKVTC
jgi:hypothetical protein